MQLTQWQEANLKGEFGASVQFAMQMLVQLGRLTSARQMIPVESAHIDGCLYHGQASLDFAKQLVDWGGRVVVPTTLNVSSLDRMTPV